MWGIILLVVIGIKAVLAWTNYCVHSDAKSFISLMFLFCWLYSGIISSILLNFSQSAFLKWSLGFISVHIGAVEILYVIGMLSLLVRGPNSAKVL